MGVNKKDWQPVVSLKLKNRYALLYKEKM